MMSDWWEEIVSWGDKPRYEPAPPVDENPWYQGLYLDEVPEKHDGTFVYLFETSDAYKIGISKDVPARLAFQMEPNDA